MAYPKVKGSIILKLLILVAAAVLAAAIYVPNRLWTLERAEEDECHFRMLALAEIQTLWAGQHNLTYADSLSKIIELVHSDSSFRARCDTAIIKLDKQIRLEAVKNNAPLRLYKDVPLTVDSIFHCPTNGLLYKLVREEETKYRISCPQEEEIIKVYWVFEKENVNHGEVNQNKEKSWK